VLLMVTIAGESSAGASAAPFGGATKMTLLDVAVVFDGATRMAPSFGFSTKHGGCVASSHGGWQRL